MKHTILGNSMDVSVNDYFDMDIQLIILKSSNSTTRNIF